MIKTKVLNPIKLIVAINKFNGSPLMGEGSLRNPLYSIENKKTWLKTATELQELSDNARAAARVIRKVLEK